MIIIYVTRTILADISTKLLKLAKITTFNMKCIQLLISRYNWDTIQLYWIIILDFGRGKGGMGIQSNKEGLKTLTQNQKQEKEQTKLQITNLTSYKFVKQIMLYEAKT